MRENEMTNDEKLKALMDSEIDGFVIQYGLLSNDEKRKALIESEIDSFAIRYGLSDAAKRAIKKIFEFDKLGTDPVEIECDGYPLSLTSLINLMELSRIRQKDCKAICFYIPID